jgi:hypothetical protein
MTPFEIAFATLTKKMLAGSVINVAKKAFEKDKDDGVKTYTVETPFEDEWVDIVKKREKEFTRMEKINRDAMNLGNEFLESLSSVGRTASKGTRLSMGDNQKKKPVYKIKPKGKPKGK